MKYVIMARYTRLFHDLLLSSYLYFLGRLECYNRP